MGRPSTRDDLNFECSDAVDVRTQRVAHVHRGHPEQLAAVIDLHAQAAVEVVIVDPDRGNRVAFNRGMDDLGFVRSERKVSGLPGSGLPYKGRLLSYRRDALD